MTRAMYHKHESLARPNGQSGYSSHCNSDSSLPPSFGILWFETCRAAHHLRAPTFLPCGIRRTYYGHFVIQAEKRCAWFRNRIDSAIGALARVAQPLRLQLGARNGFLLSHRVLAFSILSCILVACQTPVSLSVDDGALKFCVASKAITWNQMDTTETIEQIKEHNAIGARLCGWGGK